MGCGRPSTTSISSFAMKADGPPDRISNGRGIVSGYHRSIENQFDLVSMSLNSLDNRDLRPDLDTGLPKSLRDSSMALRVFLPPPLRSRRSIGSSVGLGSLMRLPSLRRRCCARRILERRLTTPAPNSPAPTRGTGASPALCASAIQSVGPPHPRFSKSGTRFRHHRVVW